MKIILYLTVAIVCCGTAFGQSAIYDMSGSFKVVEADGSIKSVPLDPDNMDYQRVQRWIAAGGVVQPAPAIPAAQRRAEMRERILTLHVRRYALTVERDYWQSQGDTTRVNAIQSLLDNAQVQIDILRPQT